MVFVDQFCQLGFVWWVSMISGSSSLGWGVGKEDCGRDRWRSGTKGYYNQSLKWGGWGWCWAGWWSNFTAARSLVSGWHGGRSFYLSLCQQSRHTWLTLWGSWETFILLRSVIVDRQDSSLYIRDLKVWQMDLKAWKEAALVQDFFILPISLLQLDWHESPVITLKYFKESLSAPALS